MLISNPYMPLFEDYEVCTVSRSSVLSSQIGIAAMNLQWIAPLALFGILCLGVLIKFLCNPWASVDEKFEDLCALHYTDREKSTALDALSTVLLVHRDELIIEIAEGKDTTACLTTENTSAVHALTRNLAMHFNNPEVVKDITTFLHQDQVNL
jgi:hypothetical protein